MTKPTKWPVLPLKTLISLGVRPVWSESLLSAWRKFGFLVAQQRLWSAWIRPGWLVFTGCTGHFVSFVFAECTSHFIGFVMGQLILKIENVTMEQIWATSWQNQQNGMCAQRRLSSAWVSVQSDQSSLSAWRKLGSLATHWVHQSSLSAWRKLGSLATHWVHSKDSDQTGQMPRLIWVFAGCTSTLLVLSWGGSFSVWLCPDRSDWEGGNTAGLIHVPTSVI